MFKMSFTNTFMYLTLRMRVNSDSASLPGRQRTTSGGGAVVGEGGGSGNISPIRKFPIQVPEGRLFFPSQSPGVARQLTG